MDPQWIEKTVVYLPHLGHMAKMAAMFIYGKKKTFKKFSSREAKGQLPWGLVCSIWDMGPIKFEKIITFG